MSSKPSQPEAREGILGQPSSTPADLGTRLEAQGLRAVEQMTYMSLELAPWAAPSLPSDVAVKEVLDDA
jgi:hypothetical protein